MSKYWVAEWDHNVLGGIAVVRAKRAQDVPRIVRARASADVYHKDRPIGVVIVRPLEEPYDEISNGDY